jgi:hypothetical protein
MILPPVILKFMEALPMGRFFSIPRQPFIFSPAEAGNLNFRPTAENSMQEAR